MEQENNETIKRSYELIDVIKFVLAIFVVGIHSEIMSNSDNISQWYILHILFRIAVPFFFVSSGFFFWKKIRNGNINKNAKKQLKRLIIPFLFWLAVSLPYMLIISDIGNRNPINVFFSLLKQFIFYPWGAMWFVSAIMISIIIESVIIKKGKFKYAIIISVLLYIVALCGNSYYFLLEGTFLKQIMDKYLQFFISVRNGIFLGFPLFTAGVFISKNEESIEKINNKRLILLLFIFISMQILEVTLIRGHNYIDDHSLFFSTLLVAPMLLAICVKNKKLKFKRINTVLLRNLSTGIYFMHKSLVLYYLTLINNDISDWIKFSVTCIISITICLVLYKINNKYVNYLIK